jgi:DNA repair photolyase
MDFIANKTILTPASGYIKDGFSHSINIYSGCAFAGALCGTYCYAQHNNWITKGRKWQLYGAKNDINGAYTRDFLKLRRKNQKIKILMSSSTDPYIPQEKNLGLTRSLLETMLQYPPDVLSIQSHNTLAERDFDLIMELSAKTDLWLSLTVETDLETIPGFPPQASSPAKRLAVLKKFRHAGVKTQAAISPLLPIDDIHQFGLNLNAACDRVVIDHFLLGDGSPNGLRTKKTDFIERLEQNGFKQWARLEKMQEVADIFRNILGNGRVLISRDGFNSV